MNNLIASSGSKENLTALINKYYYSSGYFINADNRAENTITGKIIRKIIFKRNRYYYYN